MQHAQRAKALENRVETVYREALAELFSGPQDVSHVVKMLKKREAYRETRRFCSFKERIAFGFRF